MGAPLFAVPLCPAFQSTQICIGAARPTCPACLCGLCPRPVQESDAYEFATPVEILGPLGGKAGQCQVDDDPAVPFWDALEAKKWGLRKVRCGAGSGAVWGAM